MTSGDAAPVAFWLLPAKRDAGFLQARLEALALRHGGPTFEPHVTLHVGTRGPSLRLEPLMADLARQADPLELECLDTGHSGAYYKALFVQLSGTMADGARLAALRDRLIAALASAGAPPSAYAFDPHLSLLYGSFDAALRQDIAEGQRLRGRRIRFDRLAAVRPAPGSADLARVMDWEVFGRCRLGLAG